MSFSTTAVADTIRFTEGHILTADVQTADKTKHQTSTIDLNTCLGNMNGVFTWGERNFSCTAIGTAIFLNNIEEDGVVLESSLRREDGTYNTDRINLNEKIENKDGKLVYNPDYSTPA